MRTKDEKSSRKLKYTKPLLKPFKSDGPQIGRGLCMNGLTDGDCQAGNKAVGTRCQNGAQFTPS